MIQRFIIATIGSPFGLDGFVKIRSMSGEIDHLLALSEATVFKDGKEQTLKIEEAAAYPLVMRFAGFDTPEKAKTLSGAKLLAGRGQAAPLKPGEFYIEDLKGLPVITKDGKTIGHITDVIEGGGGALAELKLSEQRTVNSEQLKENKQEQVRLVPFRKEFFPKIDPEMGRVVIDNLWILE